MSNNTPKKLTVGAMAGFVTLVTVASEHGICTDRHIWCAPPPVDHSDEPARDGPGPLLARPIVAVTSASSARIAGSFPVSTRKSGAVENLYA